MSELGLPLRRWVGLLTTPRNTGIWQLAAVPELEKLSSPDAHSPPEEGLPVTSRVSWVECPGHQVSLVIRKNDKVRAYSNTQLWLFDCNRTGLHTMDVNKLELNPPELTVVGRQVWILSSLLAPYIHTNKIITTTTTTTAAAILLTTY